MREVSISVIKYDQEFTKRSKDLKRNVWFSFPNDLLLHPDFDDITGEELKWFIWCISVCSKVNSSLIRLNVDHACRKLNLKAKDFDSMCEKLQGKQIVTDTTARRPQDDRKTTASRPLHNITEHNKHNITEHNSDLDFEAAYFLYPLKKGKSDGIKKLQKEIKTKDDLQLFIKAVENYSKDIKANKTEPKYIKHFSTFCGQWRDWVDYQPMTKIAFENTRQDIIDDFNLEMKKLKE